MKARVIAFLIILATVGFALPLCKKINPGMFWIYSAWCGGVLVIAAYLYFISDIFA